MTLIHRALNSKIVIRLKVAMTMILLGSLAQVNLCHAADNSRIFVPSGDGKFSLAGKIEYLDDQDGKFEINQVANAKFNEFKLLDRSKQLGYEYKKKALWLRFATDLTHYTEPYWFLSYDYEHIGNLQVFYPSGLGFERMEMADHLPNEGRIFNIREYIFKIPSSVVSPTYYYVRVVPDSRFLKIDLSWAGTKGYVESIHNVELAYGLFFGGLLVMWLYNLALYVYLRDLAYLYYTYYLGCFTAVFFHIYGFAPYLFRLTPFWEQVFAACGYGAIHGMVLFARQFLTLKTSVKWMDQYLQFFQWVLLAGGIAAFFQPVGVPFKYLNFLILLIIPIIIVAGATRWYQGYAPAKIYSLGWVVFASALALLSLRSVGVLPANIITNHAVMVASVWEAVIFSIALAFRIKLIEKEKNESLTKERAYLEQRVVDRTKSLQASLESNRMMIANASHELRTPVNALSLLLDSTAMSGAESSEVIPRVSIIAAHMSQLIENLLLLDADRHGAVRGGVIQDFNLADEINATCKMLGPMRQGSLALFSNDVDECLGIIVKGDLTSLRRILINLLSNAFKFTTEGSVTLKASANFNPLLNKFECRINIKDTGAGIEIQMQERIFDAFVTSGAQCGHTGTGLGLAISRQLARNLGGHLNLVQSVQNKGSEFDCLVLFEPATDLTGVDRSSDPGQIVVPLKKRLRILLAEDDVITAEAVQLIILLLQHEVYHVSTYEMLRQALTESNEPFDVALIDHRLPGGTGLDMIKICRDNKIAVNTRMILVTADATLDVIELAQTICDAVITKPTTAHRLRQLLGEGDHAIKNISEKNLLDSDPLTMLRQSGAQNKDLIRICKMFYEMVHSALEQIKHMPPMSTPPTMAVLSLNDVVHRTRGGCLAVGAVGLNSEFELLAACTNADSAMIQFDRTMIAFDKTRGLMEILLLELVD